MIFWSSSFRESVFFAKKLLPSLCFSAQITNFVKRAKTLEELKNATTLPDCAFQRGRYMLLLRCESVFTDGHCKLLWKNFQDIQSLAQNHLRNETILLDISAECGSNETCLFAIDLTETSIQDVKEFETKLGGKFINARESLLKLNCRDCKYVAQAKGLSHFKKTFNFCPKCGNELISNVIGTQKQCQKCQQTHYPIVFPVGIVLLDDIKHEKVLLVHQKRHPHGMYSCVAGFIEPGETLYESVLREVAEEVGLNVLNVEFCTSQHWAMPASQLMLACMGTVDGDEFDLDEREILSAKWVGYDTLRKALSPVTSVKGGMSVAGETDLWVPPPFTAAHQLMLEWLKKYHPL